MREQANLPVRVEVLKILTIQGTQAELQGFYHPPKHAKSYLGIFAGKDHSIKYTKACRIQNGRKVPIQEL